MSVSTLPASLSLPFMGVRPRALDIAKVRFDRALVRYDAWFLVFTAVILALGATLLIGMAVWCVTRAGGRRFTGAWSFKDFGLKVNFECV